MRGLAWAVYRRALASPFRYGARELREREGVALRLPHNGKFIYAEASPLPGHSRETLAEVVASLEAGGANPGPALSFGLAALETQATNGSLLPFPIRTNGLLPWRGGTESTLRLAELATQGFTCFKLKVPADQWEPALELVAAHPAFRFRLDANGTLDSSIAPILARWAPRLRNLEYVEEPGSWTSPWLSEARVAFAADESAADPAAWPSLRAASAPPAFWIAKPTVSGPLTSGPAPRTVFTSSMEAEPGRRALIAWLGATADRAREAAGLATGFLFSENYFPDLPIYTELPALTEAEERWLASLEWRKISP